MTVYGVSQGCKEGFGKFVEFGCIVVGKRGIEGEFVYCLNRRGEDGLVGMLEELLDNVVPQAVVGLNVSSAQSTMT